MFEDFRIHNYNMFYRYFSKSLTRNIKIGTVLRILEESNKSMYLLTYNLLMLKFVNLF